MGTAFYPSRDETYRYMREGNFMPPWFFKTRREGQIELRVRYRQTFMYAEFACIVDYLVGMGGKAKFLAYMKRLLVDGDHEAVFREAYGMGFEEALRGLRQRAAQTAGEGKAVRMNRATAG